MPTAVKPNLLSTLAPLRVLCLPPLAGAIDFLSSPTGLLGTCPIWSPQKWIWYCPQFWVSMFQSNCGYCGDLQTFGPPKALTSPAPTVFSPVHSTLTAALDPSSLDTIWLFYIAMENPL